MFGGLFALAFAGYTYARREDFIYGCRNSKGFALRFALIGCVAIVWSAALYLGSN